MMYKTDLRGGSWNNNADNCRVANRNNNNPDNRNNNNGFRVFNANFTARTGMIRSYRACFIIAQYYILTRFRQMIL
ncbi:MAG: hypothetical protein FJ042_08305 [Candidatus Cloacimonetes bacterium]|nr:hypothetical protein [Candidatus Cloacimonadota bacterium]